jgi:hypothetical protein
MKQTAQLLEELDQTQALIMLCDAADTLHAQRERLESLINELIQNDFHLLVQWLYRIDVDEKRIKVSLETQRGSDAAAILAMLILERQQQKIESRKKYRSSADIPEEDRW